VLLRGINLGSHNRIAMPALREALTGAGFDDVRTYVASGNVVLSSGRSADRVARECERIIEDAFGLSIPVVVRTREELAEVVGRNPLGDVAEDPKRYQVSFLSAAPSDEVVAKLDGLAVEPERFVLIDREFYSWHPDGVGRSKLWSKLAGKGLGVTATGRNWTTVTTLLAMAQELAGER
jgi:uncharacterized protein (DUF1697 family)